LKTRGFSQQISIAAPGVDRFFRPGAPASTSKAGGMILSRTEAVFDVALLVELSKTPRNQGFCGFSIAQLVDFVLPQEYQLAGGSRGSRVQRNSIYLEIPGDRKPLFFKGFGVDSAAHCLCFDSTPWSICLEQPGFPLFDSRFRLKTLVEQPGIPWN